MERLTLAQAIHNAIEAEHAAESFYAALAARCENADTHSFFRAMAVREHLHAESVAAFFTVPDGGVASWADLPVDGVETLPVWEDRPDLSLAEALELAKRCERHAADYYARMSAATDGPVASFFLEMQAYEEDHVCEIDRIRGVLGV